jgi:hypothetical protein
MGGYHFLGGFAVHPGKFGTRTAKQTLLTLDFAVQILNVSGTTMLAHKYSA